ncbi:hypothetical protein RchiOBHm_Chr7g0212941 [Rosa chinensis]|uniref:Uncharacterized protein n=1 Tax=Rosa chinensis TaxID=74649 RepID=A0A2P6PAV7_ROSCH|nr:hypothetical protein RchiOBHm_Chr7g0212941 [Rosa chinensis]
MSGGTPTGGYMRQRHSQGYASSGDDLEDDACLMFHSSPASSPRVWSSRDCGECNLACHSCRHCMLW